MHKFMSYTHLYRQVTRHDVFASDKPMKEDGPKDDASGGTVAILGYIGTLDDACMAKPPNSMYLGTLLLKQHGTGFHCLASCFS